MNTLMNNIGSTDKKVRITLGITVFITLFALKSWFFLLGAVILATGLLDFCPVYHVLGINTCKEPKKWWK